MSNVKKLINLFWKQDRYPLFYYLVLALVFIFMARLFMYDNISVADIIFTSSTPFRTVYMVLMYTGLLATKRRYFAKKQNMSIAYMLPISLKFKIIVSFGLFIIYNVVALIILYSLVFLDYQIYPELYPKVLETSFIQICTESLSQNSLSWLISFIVISTLEFLFMINKYYLMYLVILLLFTILLSILNIISFEVLFPSLLLLVVTIIWPIIYLKLKKYQIK